MKHVPAVLVASRIVLGPLLVLACLNGLPFWIVAILVVTMLSDIFDGVIARRLKIVTANLRVMDSRADAWFFISVGVAAWLTVPDIVRAYAIPLIAELVIQVASYAYDMLRYGRIATFHAYSAKLWGLSLYVAVAALLAFHQGALIWMAFGFGLVAALGALAIKLILPEWKHDVLSCFHAWPQRVPVPGPTERPRRKIRE